MLRSTALSVFLISSSCASAQEQLLRLFNVIPSNERVKEIASAAENSISDFKDIKYKIQLVDKVYRTGKISKQSWDVIQSTGISKMGLVGSVIDSVEVAQISLKSRNGTATNEELARQQTIVLEMANKIILASYVSPQTAAFVVGLQQVTKTYFGAVTDQVNTYFNLANDINAYGIKMGGLRNLTKPEDVLSGDALFAQILREKSSQISNMKTSADFDNVLISVREQYKVYIEDGIKQLKDVRRESFDKISLRRVGVDLASVASATIMPSSVDPKRALKQSLDGSIILLETRLSSLNNGRDNEILRSGIIMHYSVSISQIAQMIAQKTQQLVRNIPAQTAAIKNQTKATITSSVSATGPIYFPTANTTVQTVQKITTLKQPSVLGGGSNSYQESGWALVQGVPSNLQQNFPAAPLQIGGGGGEPYTLVGNTGSNLTIAEKTFTAGRGNNGTFNFQAMVAYITQEANRFPANSTFGLDNATITFRNASGQTRTMTLQEVFGVNRQGLVIFPSSTTYGARTTPLVRITQSMSQAAGSQISVRVNVPNSVNNDTRFPSTYAIRNVQAR